MNFVISLYNIKLDEGRHFLHEHPAEARSWGEAQMKRLLNHPRVSTTISDQCQYGLVTPREDGGLLPAKKPTRWASTSSQMLDRLSARCPGDHLHQHLIGGCAANAAYYPPELITNIWRGCRTCGGRSGSGYGCGYDMPMFLPKLCVLLIVNQT